MTGLPTPLSILSCVPLHEMDVSNRLLADYQHHAPALRPFFTVFPPITTPCRTPDRAKLAAALTVYQQQLGADPRAVAAATRLADPSTPVVCVGQQPGLLTGPLYTPLKALTAISVARYIGAVPVFWIGADDDDRAEVDHCGWWDRQEAWHTIHYPAEPGIPGQLVGDLPTGPSGEVALAQLLPLLDGMPFAGSILDVLRETLAASADMGTWCARLLARLCSRHGLVMCDARLPIVRQLATPRIQEEIDQPLQRTRLLNAQAQTIHRAGYRPALTKPEDVCNFFLYDTVRHRVTYIDGRFHAGDATYSPAELTTLLAREPERFIPNAVLRPLVQETLFSSSAFIAGPNEVGYWAELRPLFTSDVPMPPVMPRVGITLVPARCARLLRAWEAAPIELLHTANQVRQTLFARLEPPIVQAAFTAGRMQVAQTMDDLRQAMETVDGSLAESVLASHQRMRNEVDRLEHKTRKALERQSSELTRRFTEVRETLFPGHGPQERTLNLFAAMARYGLDLPDRLLDVIDKQEGTHLFVEL